MRIEPSRSSNARWKVRPNMFMSKLVLNDQFEGWVKSGSRTVVTKQANFGSV